MNIKKDYNSTSLNSTLILRCNDLEDENMLTAVCSVNGSWIPSVSEYTCVTETIGPAISTSSELL